MRPIPSLSTTAAPSPATFTRLVSAATALQRLAPWTWMSEDQIFAVQNPDTGDYGYCSVLGALGEFFALIVYTGEEGLRWCQASPDHIEATPLDKIDWMLGRSCLMVGFVERHELSSHERTALQNAGFTPRGKSSWPEFQHHAPGLEQWHPGEDDARFLATTIEQALIVCERAKRDDASVFTSEPRVYLTRTPIQRDGQIMWEDRWLKHEPPSEPLDIAPMQPGALADLRRLAVPRSGVWEADYFYLPDLIKPFKHKRGIHPRMLMIADHDSGLVLDAKAEDKAPAPAALRDFVLNMATKSGHLPQTLLVKRFDAYTALSEPAQELGAEIKLQGDLPAIVQAVESFLEHSANHLPERDTPFDPSPEPSSRLHGESRQPAHSRVTGRPGLDTHLTERERDELQEFLSSQAAPKGTMWLDAYDGLSAAMASGPGLVMPSLWLEALWNGQEPRVRDLKQVQRILDLLMRHHNSVVDRIGDGTYSPLLLGSKSERAESVTRWCGGFVRGMELAGRHWDARKNDRQLWSLVAPIVMFTLKDAWSIAATEAPGADLTNARSFARAVLSLRKYWQKWGPPPERLTSQGPITSTKIDRNDPCPCGSGKKYKKCCGSGQGLLDLVRADLTWKGPSLNKSEIDEILRADWDDPDGAVRLARDLTDGELADVPMLTNAVAYLSTLAEVDKVQLTANGNLKVELVMRLREQFVITNSMDQFVAERKSAPRERDVQPLVILRGVCEVAGLTRNNRKELSITDTGRACIQESRRGELFRRLFVANFTRFRLPWAERLTGFDAAQRTMGHTLFVLKWELADWVSPQELAMKAFLPSVQAEFSAAQDAWAEFAHERPAWTLSAAVLEPLVQFGLVKCRYGEGFDSDQIAEVRKTELFDRFVEFAVPR